MPGLCVLLALAIVVLTAIGIVRKMQVQIVLLFAGLALNILALLFGAESILPRGGKPTGFIGFDLFEAIRACAHSQLMSAGFIMLLAGGFAEYMDRIGASDRLVDVCTKPLSKIAHPYLILAAVFVVGHLLSLVITTAAGLAMLLAVTVFPLLTRLGISGVSVAAILASAVMFSWAPTSSLAILGAELSGIDPMTYLIEHQLAVGIPVVAVMTAAHYFVQKHLDAKDFAAGRIAGFDAAGLEKANARAAGKRRVPAFFAAIPLIPIVLLLIFNKSVMKTIVIDVPTAMIIGWVAGILADLLFRRDAREVFKDAAAMFSGMGKMLTNVVSLIFVAALFASGLQNAGVVSTLIDMSRSMGFGLAGSGLIVSGVISAVTVLTGSGVAAFTSLVPIAPDLANAFGGSAASLAVMMQCGGEIVRAMSPVAGVVIIVAGFAGASPLEVVRRTAVPCAAGWAAGMIASFLML